MKTKKIIAMLLAVMMIISFAACGGDDGGEQQGGTDNQGTTVTEGAVKTGISIVTDLSSSKDAGDEAGLAQADITIVAVTVDDNGVINDCAIDMIQGKVNFDATGTVTTDLATEVLSKNELGTNYGMHKASSIGKDWHEQAQAFADYVVGKTVAEVKGIAVNESGKATDADLSAGVTISIGSFVTGVENAVNNATHLGAQAGDVLNVESVTSIADSTNASATDSGVAQVYATIGAVTTNGETITSSIIDAVQANVSFDTTGKISTDLTAGAQTKNQLGTNYGMSKVSSIGKDWHEQAAAFSSYITGKTVAEVSGIAVNESGKATDADLSAGVTVSIGDFMALIAKVGK